jgi:hypothetical protein
MFRQTVEADMKMVDRETHRSEVPKRRQQHHSYDESVDESAKLIDDESVEVEREAPAEENEPEERVEDESSPDAPTFEE